MEINYDLLVDYRSSKLIGYNILLRNKDLSSISKDIVDTLNIKRTDNRKKYRLHMEVVLTNLLRSRRKERIYYSRDTHNSSSKTRYNIRGLSTRILIKVIDVLEEHGMLTNTIGVSSKTKENRMPSFIQPTDLFLDTFSDLDVLSESVEEQYLDYEESIILRDEHKELINFRDNNYTRTARAVVVGLNATLRNFKFRDKGGNLITNHYCRIFNESFDKGGRFYRAGILQLKNKDNNYERLKVTCNEEPMIEIDFCNLHIMLLCILNKFQYKPEVDMYAKCVPVDLYNNTLRGLVKTAINIMLNAKTPQGASRAITKLVKETRKKYPDSVPESIKTGKNIMDWVYKGHPKLKELFCNIDSTGLMLQKMDSDIAHHVVHYFVSMEKPILVVHDSFIVRRSDKFDLVNAMVEALQTVVERSDIIVPLKAEWWDKDSGYMCEKFLA